ncbi:MAG: UDP-N-acetylmuramoyl-tripeptide--D-alanyl-D-alanine ligase [Candidatus Omnitrophica bacterium]|nr:UDP-N-acetylmuramoyl-tripeptide--D-alanyl-D-alanine ligase [Candidatus Omnitrophota bacterium]
MFTIREIIEATGGRLTQGPAHANVRGVSIDSRTVRKGDLFIAIQGDTFDGHDFVRDVVGKGIRVVLVAKPVAVRNKNGTVIRVVDTVRALGHLAHFHRMRFKIPVLAITGSAGKTTTKEMIAAVLRRKYTVLKNEGTQNNHIGVPMTLLKLKKSHQAAVLECATNQPGDIPWLAQVVRPDIAVLTNIGVSHLERLKDTNGVLREKWQMTSFMPRRAKVVLNTDDPLLAKVAAREKKLNVITYAIHSKARFQAKDIGVVRGCRLRLILEGKTIELRSCGRNNAYNALAAFACGRLLGVAPHAAVKALSAFCFPKGRQEFIRLGKGWLINDSYNANPVSMDSAIETLSVLKGRGKKILVAADMLELGTKSAAYHRSAGKRTAQAGIDILITVGPLARNIARGAVAARPDMTVFSYDDAHDARAKLKEIWADGDAVLVKGSRRMKMETIVGSLLKG